jgi:hypothetical protein
MRIDSRVAGRYVAVAFAVAAAAAPFPAFAQNEGALRAFFEGKAVALRIDMPGSSEGVDVFPDAGGLNATAYGNRMKAYGTSLRTGDRALVTLVKVKKDSIEFQLGGGGFGTFGDNVSTSVNLPPLIDKSRREIELEKRVREEDNPRVRRDLQRELNDLRDNRERQNRRIEAERLHLQEMQRERVASQRLQGGSRFNIHFVGSVPRDVRADDVMAALGEYVDFSPMRGGPPPMPSSFDASILKKGMPRADVERALGRIVQASEHRDSGLLSSTLVFDSGNERITTEFVEDVLVRWSINSK